MAVQMIDREQYPELDLIMWDRADRYVTPQDALHLYETRWRFVDKERLCNKEKTLIRKLTDDHGHGVMLSA